jgi:hypothetical protein
MISLKLGNQTGKAGLEENWAPEMIPLKGESSYYPA